MRSATDWALKPPKTTSESTHAAAGKHGDGSLGNHGHVDQHHVPFLDTSGLEHIGKEADLAMKLPVGQDACSSAGFPGAAGSPSQIKAA